MVNDKETPPYRFILVCTFVTMYHLMVGMCGLIKIIVIRRRMGTLTITKSLHTIAIVCTLNIILKYIATGVCISYCNYPIMVGFQVYARQNGFVYLAHVAKSTIPWQESRNHFILLVIITNLKAALTCTKLMSIRCKLHHVRHQDFMYCNKKYMHILILLAAMGRRNQTQIIYFLQERTFQ